MPFVALAGRRVDASDAAAPRFPLANVPVVRERLHALLRERGATGLVASAACGADLLAHDVARALGIHRVMVLPHRPVVFRERSVADRPGDWGPLFDELLADARRSGEVVELDLPVGEHASEPYLRTNEAILGRAGAGALAVVVWDGASRGPDDVTAAFAATARASGSSVVEVMTSA